MSTMYRRLVGAGIVVMLALAGTPPPARAELSSPERACLEGLAKASRTFVKKKLKAIQQCNNGNLKTPGRCIPPDLAADIAELETKLRAQIDGKCSPVNISGLLEIGFPGKCFDPLVSDGFTSMDLKNCMAGRHEQAVDHLIDVDYGTTANVVLPLSLRLRLCQEAIAKAGATLTVAVLNAVQKCRNDVNAGHRPGFDPSDCGTADPKTVHAIEQAIAKARASITGKCTVDDINALDVCEPPYGTLDDALDCIIDAHRDAADASDPSQTDLIDVEYAEQPICGDGVRNTVDEECDGSDAVDCPGQCGAATGDFPCLCLGIPRQRVIEHANADLDNGSSGQNHDADIVEGGGYVTDLYDCDPNMGDYDCTVGPSCSVAPHPPCSNDAQCAFFGLGTCRKTRTANGPHCKFDVQQTCSLIANVGTDCQPDPAECPGTGNCCQKQFHGPPLPLAAGGQQVCVVNVFSEDITGTTNRLSGASAVRLRQRAITHLGPPPANRPCPTCGGFCDAPLGMGTSPGNRTACANDADCPGSHCITALVCSYGPHADKPCRPNPPYGGTTEFFGTTSVDCPPITNISGAGLDILFNPATTGTVTLTPQFECDAAAFTGERCVGGPNEGRPCTGPGDCPSGSCNGQCFCPNIGSNQQPNACNDACVSTGADDKHPCTTDAQCPTGFCHPADCRVDPSDTDSVQEGRCTVGPTNGRCSATRFKSCSLIGPSLNLDCRPPSDGGSCPFCQAGETCLPKRRECFVNSGIIRAGSPGVPNRTSAAIFCIPATGSSTINIVAGLPGPGALTQPVTVSETGF